MARTQLYALFLCSLVIWTVGNGLVPLLPVHATQLGAGPAVAGYYLAFSYAALAIGAVAAGWISDRLDQRKAPLVAAGVAGAPTAWLMGRVGNVWALSVLTAVLWFCGGLALALVGILTGLSAGEGERGKVFGMISLTVGLGALIGGLASGFIADRWGFPTMFATVAVLIILWPLAALILTEQRVKRAQEGDASGRQGSVLGKSYCLLLAAYLASSTAGFVVVLGRSLLMNDLGFGAMAISTTGAIGGIVAMPLPLLMGWLSDRAGRRAFLYLGCLAGISGLTILAVSMSLWHFAVVMVLQTLFMSVNGTVGNALVTDLVPPESLGRGLSLFGAASWVGGVLGFAGAGYALQRLGSSTTFTIGIGLIVLAIVLLTRIGVAGSADG